MFAYNPTPDRSGEILGAGQMQAAQTNADMMKGLGEDIGGAIASLAGSYVQGKQLKAKADAYGEFLGMHGGMMFGEQSGEVLDRYKNMNTAQQVQYGDMFVGDMLKGALNRQYLREQGSVYGYGDSGGGNPGTGGGGRGGAFFTMPGS